MCRKRLSGGHALSPSAAQARQVLLHCCASLCALAPLLPAPLPSSTGCGHCKRLVPEYIALGQKIAADPKLKSRVLIAKVDADAHRELGEPAATRAPASWHASSANCGWLSACRALRAAAAPLARRRHTRAAPLRPRRAGEKFGVRGFPTIKWFPCGKAADPVE